MQRRPIGKHHFTDFARVRKFPRPDHNNPWIEIKPVSPKGNQPWIFIGRPDLKFQYFGQPGANSWLIGKDPDAGKDWRQKEKRRAEEEMVRWHHQLNGHELEQTLGDSKGQESLVYCSPWDRKESNMTLQLNNNSYNSSISNYVKYLLKLCWNLLIISTNYSSLCLISVITSVIIASSYILHTMW